MSVDRPDTVTAVKERELALKEQDIREIQYNRDIGLGNQFRLEAVKHCMTIATGAFVLTVSFYKNFAQSTGHALVLALIDWALMIMSLGAGIVQMRYWEEFYISYIHDHDGKSEIGCKQRNWWKPFRFWSRTVQYTTLILGMLLISLLI
jgi:hypothetical protein